VSVPLAILVQIWLDWSSIPVFGLSNLVVSFSWLGVSCFDVSWLGVFSFSFSVFDIFVSPPFKFFPFYVGSSLACL